MNATVVVQHASDWLRFTEPRQIVAATHLADVLPALRQIDEATKRGQFAAGFITYEAAPAFDEAFVVRQPGPLPLLWFGIYECPAKLAALSSLPGTPSSSSLVSGGTNWQPSVTQDEYHQSIARVRDLIAAGDTYQVNYTLRLCSAFDADPWPFFVALNQAQRSGFSAYVDLGEHVICSASPELFFKLDGETIECRPMKGTAPRGRSCEEDAAKRQWLADSEKNRAENLMIVDMVRNDLGRIARFGSVRVPRLFEVEQYPTVWQMTSTVTAETRAPIPEVFSALFPCASITGAPKVRTMQIVAELEREPRGIYTGCIGFIGPGRRAQFNVAIRTVHCDRVRKFAEYGTGGGIVWDSTADDEYAECLTKARVLSAAPRPKFELLETLLWRPKGGYFLLDRHLDRLANSARYFGFPCDAACARAQLAQRAAQFGSAPQRVRLLLGETGEARIESKPLELARRPWTVAFAADPIDSANPMLFHKTTSREVYDAARRSVSGVDDVILWNERGEVTETTIANIVVRLHGEYLTPELDCGLLPGTLRAELLARGAIREARISREELQGAEAIYLANSVRGVLRAKLI